MKTLLIANVSKAIVKEARKYKLTANLDKATSKFVITIQKKG